MKQSSSFAKERILLLTTGFILLAATITLTYLRPQKTASDVSELALYEDSIKQEWYTQTRTLLSQANWQAAKICANKILVNFPNDVFARRALVRVAVEQNKTGIAESLCRQLIKETPEDAVSRSNLAVILYSVSLREAHDAINTARQLMPEHPAIKYNHQYIDDMISGKPLSVRPIEDALDPEILVIPMPKEVTAL